MANKTLIPQLRRAQFASLTLCLLLVGSSTLTKGQESAGQSVESLNYGFVSPNTKENLKLEEAIKGMNSPEEYALLKKGVNLGCVVRAKVRGWRALGSWSDGAEQSLVLRVKTDESGIRYLLARMGRDAQQKSVLYFHPRKSGKATIYTLTPRKNLRNLVAIATRLEGAGISFRTLVPTANSTLIYIVDVNRELRPKVLAAAKKLGARVASEPGNATFVGAEQASQAQEVFAQEIKNYESKNPNLPPTCDLQRSKTRGN